MGEVSSLRVGRFMRLPQRSDERWQGGLVRLPSWVDEPDGPFRPWTANTNDNQGVRDLLLPALLVAGRDDEAAALLERYDDAMAVWRYGRALVTFRREGDSASTRERLREALRANRRVAKYLAGAAPLPDQDPDSYALGSEEEAVIAARTLAEAWSVTPGAGAWLAAAGGGGRGGSKKRRR